MTPTIKDVAKLAGVSIATVSRALNGERRITETTRSTVERAAQQLGYQGNVLARNLRAKSNRTILVIVPNITAFFSGVLQGIEDELGPDYYVLLGNTKNDRRREESFLNLLLQRGADGAIVTSVRTGSTQLLDLSRKIPVVLACQYLEDPLLPTVSVDNVRAAMEAATYLVNLGHRRIAHLAGPLDIVVSRDRVRGYSLGLAGAGLPSDPTLVKEGDFTYESGYERTRELLSQPGRPTAIFASSDEMAAGAIRAVQHQGLRVPQDVSVVGFDDTQIASIFDLPITTVSQPVGEIGRTAVRLLLRLKADPSGETTRIKVDHHLVVRQSAGPVPS